MLGSEVVGPVKPAPMGVAAVPPIVPLSRAPVEACEPVVYWLICSISDVDAIPMTVMQHEGAARQFATGCVGRSAVLPVVPKTDYDREREARERAEVEIVSLRIAAQNAHSAIVEHIVDGSPDDETLANAGDALRAALASDVGAALAERVARYEAALKAIVESKWRTERKWRTEQGLRELAREALAEPQPAKKACHEANN